jgi:predicted TIM-barrel fold metal-dependent hydrolase
LGPERVLFGTDQTLLSVGASVGLYRDAAMTPAEAELVLYGNARRIFGL